MLTSIYSIIWREFTKFTAWTKKSPVKDFSSKCEQILSFLRICSHLPKTLLMKNFIFRAVFAVPELTFVLKFISFKRVLADSV